MRIFFLALSLSGVLLGQDQTRVFSMTNTSPVGLQEVATTLRTALDIRTLSLDRTASTVSVTGSPAQLAACEWLLPKLDAAASPDWSPQRYAFDAGGNDLLEVIPLQHSPQAKDIQEILTSLRTVVAVDKIYQISDKRLLILHTSKSLMNQAEWLVSKMDAGAPEGPGTQLAVDEGPILQVFYLAQGANLGTLIQSVRQMGVSRMYVRSNPPMLMASGTAEQMTAVGKVLPLQ